MYCHAGTWDVDSTFDIDFFCTDLLCSALSNRPKRSGMVALNMLLWLLKVLPTNTCYQQVPVSFFALSLGQYNICKMWRSQLALPSCALPQHAKKLQMYPMKLQENALSLYHSYRKIYCIPLLIYPSDSAERKPLLPLPTWIAFYHTSESGWCRYVLLEILCRLVSSS